MNGMNIARVSEPFRIFRLGISAERKNKYRPLKGFDRRTFTALCVMRVEICFQNGNPIAVVAERKVGAHLYYRSASAEAVTEGLVTVSSKYWFIASQGWHSWGSS